MRARMVLLVCLALAACGTPQERCISNNTRDLRTVERLIAESERNLARGFALESRTEWRMTAVPCYRSARRPGAAPILTTCWDDRPETVTRPRAINLDEEAAKLASLQRKRDQLARQAQSVVAQCRALHPEDGA